MFCWALVKKDSLEPWLLRTSLKHRTGVFGCHQHIIYSDEELVLDDGDGESVLPTPIPGSKAWLAPVPGTSEAVWHNTNIFMRAWRHMQESGDYRQHDWVVKVDPDTAFLPGLLQRQLKAMSGAPKWNSAGFNFMRHLDPKEPIYIVNCRRWYSLQGPLEIFSVSAADKFFSNLDVCTSGLDWEQWGEDWFVSACMDKLSINKREGFDLLLDRYCSPTQNASDGRELQGAGGLHGGCASGIWAAVHPLKTPEELGSCIAEATAHADAK